MDYNDIDAPDQTKKGWKQMLFTGEDRQALQALADNGTMTLDIQDTQTHLQSHPDNN